MATCTNCGAIYSEERTRCPNCGSLPDMPADDSYGHEYEYDSYEPDIAAREERVDRLDYAPLRRERSSAAEPAYVYSTPRDRVIMSVSSFLGAITLMSIPVIGFLIQIVWSLGGTKSQNKRNLARAYLILTIIAALLSVAALITLYSILEPYINEFMALLEMM
jgi:hypothetical protein